VLLGVLVIYAAVLQYPSVTSFDPHWGRTGIAVEPIRFADTQSLTSAWDCTRRGEPVLAENPCDPLGRPANYPSLWMKLTFLGLGLDDSVEVGVAIGLLFLASLFVLAGPLTLLEGAVWSLLVVSPSVMLGVERGNADILLFALCVAAVTAIASRPAAARAAGVALLELAAMLKLFPIFAAGAVLHARRRWALASFGLLAGVFAVYAFSIRDELETIRRVVPRRVELSYGSGALADGLRAAFGTDAWLLRDRTVTTVLIVAATFALAAAVAAVLGRRAGGPRAPSTRLPFLWAGAGIYVGTWAFAMSNFDYRLAFALLAVPQLLEWARQQAPTVPLARSALVLLAAVLWLSDGLRAVIPFGLGRAWVELETHFPFDELLTAALSVYLSVCLLLTLPEWLPSPFRRRGAGVSAPVA
jgi:hypothetical protein